MGRLKYADMIRLGRKILKEDEAIVGAEAGLSEKERRFYIEEIKRKNYLTWS